MEEAKEGVGFHVLVHTGFGHSGCICQNFLKL